MAIALESDCASTSNSSSKDSSSENDILEQSSIVEPYSNEPLASSNDDFEENETDDEDGILSQALAQRYEKEIPVDS